MAVAVCASFGMTTGGAQRHGEAGEAGAAFTLAAFVTAASPDLAPAGLVGVDPSRAVLTLRADPTWLVETAAARSTSVAQLRSRLSTWAATADLTLTQTTSSLAVFAGPGVHLLFGPHPVDGQIGLLPVSLRPYADALLASSGAPVVQPHALLDQGPMTPSVLATHYDGHALAANLNSGAGATVATVQFDTLNMKDVSDYASEAGITTHDGQFTSVSIGGAATLANPGNQEDSLDVEAILGMAPAANQRIYFADNTYAGMLGAYSQVADDAKAGLLTSASTSWGTCETNLDAQGQSSVSADFTAAVGAGTTMTAASGDDGAYDCSKSDHPNGEAAVDFPASAPAALGVGGTLIPRQTGSAESAWGSYSSSQSDPTANYQGKASGGGRSATFATPDMQKNLTGNQGRRMVPDISSAADPNSGIPVILNGTWCFGGGTSLAAPTVAAELADIAAAHQQPHGLGNVAAVLYAHPSTVTDVVGGGNYLYSATTGYDLVTGLGTIDLAGLDKQLFGAPAPAPAPAPTATPSSPPAAFASEVPAAVNALTLPVKVAVAAPARYHDWTATETTVAQPGCPPGSATAPTGATVGAGADRATHITIAAVNDLGQCLTQTWNVTLDRSAPVLQLGTPQTPNRGSASVGLTITDQAPSSGNLRAHVTVVCTDTGATVDAVTVPAGNVTFPVTPGNSYRVTASAFDAAGNLSAAATRTLTAPLDDRDLTSRGAWNRTTDRAAYGSTITASQTRATTLAATFRGTGLSIIGVGLRNGGQFSIQIDGRRIATLSTYRSRTSEHTIFTHLQLSAGKHTLTLTTLGNHAKGSNGNWITIDQVQITP